jgi:DNA processing protein
VTGRAGTVGSLPPGAYAAALASLPCAGPAWLVDVLRTHPPKRAWELVAAGDLIPPPRTRLERTGSTWADIARGLDVDTLWARCQRGGIDVSWPGSPGYPAALLRSPSPAGVLFAVGRPDTLARRASVAVVGTRRCTPEGAAVAYQLGYDLSCAGVCAVSGLALGIDGAAHAGALAAVRDMKGPSRAVDHGTSLEERSMTGPGPGSDDAGGMAPASTSHPAGSTVGVAASGVDVVYPRQHGALWREVVRLGAIVSETPPGVPAKAWRFPSRNRLIAGLAQMVVVVECHVSGGSWHTVEAALRQGLEVGAVPGSVHNSASVGTNTLIHEGATPVRNAQDVLDALGMFDDRVPNGTGEGTAAGGRRPSSLDDRRHSQSVAGGRATRVSPAAGRPSAGAGQAGAGAPEHGGLGRLDDKVRASLNWRPLCLDEIVERSGLPAGAVVVALERLEQQGLVIADGGWWVTKQR